jgi:hypothetical protein|tara:strand:- start:82 stop:579 length:498 start_codon:yes stop_codon:yes gene_type:complete
MNNIMNDNTLNVNTLTSRNKSNSSGTRNKSANKTAYNFKLNKMNDATYKLRRNVMSVIYDAKNRGFKLPRIEVRIVSGGDSEVCGYATLGNNVIHISERYSMQHTDTLTGLVLHEIVHAVTGFMHDDDCYLMNPYLTSFPDLEKTWKCFDKYINNRDKKYWSSIR